MLSHSFEFSHRRKKFQNFCRMYLEWHPNFKWKTLSTLHFQRCLAILCTYFHTASFSLITHIKAIPKCPNFKELQAGSLNVLGIMSGYTVYCCSRGRTKPYCNMVLVKLMANKVFWPSIMHFYSDRQTGRETEWNSQERWQMDIARQYYSKNCTGPE